MPLYAYKCSACGANEEHLQKFSDPPKTECSSCGGALVKQITATAFHLKGGGWYKDLYASNKPGSSKADSDSGSSSSKGDSGSSSSSSSDSSSSGSTSSNSSSSGSSSGSGSAKAAAE